MGAMSIQDALKEFSVPTVVLYKHAESLDVVNGIEKESNIMSSLYR